jgi:hypothetical protein
LFANKSRKDGKRQKVSIFLKHCASISVGSACRFVEPTQKIKPTSRPPKKKAPAPAPKPAEYDLAGAAAHLGMSQRKLRQMVKDRRIAYRNFFLFTQADLDEYLGAYRTKPKRI